MKRLFCVILVLVCFCGCSPQKDEKPVEESPYITGVWISYTELDSMLQGDFKNEFNAAVENCVSHGITDVFVHVRPFCDAIYRSDYYPLRDTAAAYDYDILDYITQTCHKSNIKIHAWINPYRVRSLDSDISVLPENSPAKMWLCDQNPDNDINVSLYGGVYLNPASSEVNTLIINGVREIVENYDIDGIHFDDYFYPTVDTAFDELSYTNYCNNTENPLSIGDWRRANVNSLISGVYTAIKFKSKDIVFSISPSASIEKNYSESYADISSWIKNGCVDYIIPQLYFGFDYPDNNFKFDYLIKIWKKATANSNTQLLIGVAAYKIGTEQQPDCTEWQNGVDVINRQKQICLNDKDIFGHIYFSYTNMCKYL